MQVVGLVVKVSGKRETRSRATYLFVTWPLGLMHTLCHCDGKQQEDNESHFGYAEFGKDHW